MKNLRLLVLIVLLGLVIAVTWVGVRAMIGTQPAAAEDEVETAMTPTVEVEKVPTVQASVSPPYAPRLAWFYKPPKDGDLTKIAQNFDFFILTGGDEADRERMREAGAQGIFLQYLRFDAILDMEDCQQRPYQNQVANQTGDYCWIAQEHPDWFLLDGNGQKMKNDGGYVMMDPGNSGWQDFWLERARIGQETGGWDGLFLDNVEANLDKRRRVGALPGRYPDEDSYRQAVLGFLERIYQTYTRPNHRPLYANVLDVDSTEALMPFLGALDGVMVESFAVDWQDGYHSRKTWEKEMQMVESVQRMGKHVILVAQGEETDLARQEFSLASAILADLGGVTFRYTYHEEYTTAWLYDNYRVELGGALGERYAAAGGWRRDFERGSVMVQPDAGTAEIRVQP